MPTINLGLRDRIQRLLTATHEVEREAWKQIARDKTLDMRFRVRAVQALNTYSRYMRPAAVRGRCIENGRSRVNRRERGEGGGGGEGRGKGEGRIMAEEHPNYYSLSHYPSLVVLICF